MFTLDDFWKIFKHIYNNRTNGDDNDDDLEIDKNIKAIALSEFSKSTKLFENTLDQISFSSSDYRKLRKFLINWYASFRTLVKLQNESLDIFSMTEENLDELFRSFGFNYSYSIRDFETKVNFFLDLVNIYKIKGTPTALRRVLSYYGMSDASLVEYYLKLDKNKKLILQPQPSEKNISKNVLNQLKPLPFKKLIKFDPHWFQSESEILHLFDQNKINLPSKTPYFGIRPIYEFKSIEPVLAYFHRIIYDNIQDFKQNGTIQERDTKIDEIESFVSITELYLASIYCFNVVYGYSNSSDLNYVINNTDMDTDVDNYDEFKELYESIIHNSIETREKQRDKIEEHKEKLTRSTDDFFLEGKDNSIELLEQINPSFRNIINIWETSGRLDHLVPYLISTLNRWIEKNIDTSFPDLAILSLGFDGLINTKNVIDFFKPKRARFLALDISYNFSNRLFDTLLTEDKDFSVPEVTEVARSYGAPGGENCGIGYNEMIYDCGHRFDIGIVDDNITPDLEIEDNIETYDNLKNDDCITNFDHYKYPTEDSTSVSDIEIVSVTNNFHNFDQDNFTYDERGNCYQEIVNIEVETA